uniref:Uncharacterized protein n=1 Tax=Aegilops tauschii subsp. strangulata TaxID=200361 RepID=A0A453QAU4_AEGTS
VKNLIDGVALTWHVSANIYLVLVLATWHTISTQILLTWTPTPPLFLTHVPYWWCWAPTQVRPFLQCQH